jgi:hypothetical protein
MMGLWTVEAQFKYFCFVVRVLLWRQGDIKSMYCIVCGVNPPVRFDQYAPILLENKITRVLDFISSLHSTNIIGIYFVLLL